MMRGYAETTGCRRQFLLGYFGEQVNTPCDACDTCLAGEVQPTETGVATSPFRVNGSVQHAEWGPGVVMSMDPGSDEDDSPAMLTVLFESVGYKTLALDHVQDTGLLEPTG